jgi:ribosomal protein S18 acetylase RimI-like enzyme
MIDIEYCTHAGRPIDPLKLRRLYDQEAWWPERSAREIAGMLVDGEAIAAWYGDHLVGFARAISDGRFRAYIEDVIVHRDFHRSGIGTELVDRLLASLGGVHMISLFCDPSLIPFYEARGFRASQQVTMHRRTNGAG